MSYEWYRQNTHSWMNDDQFECFKMLCDLFYGAHHVGGIVKPCGKSGIENNTRYTGSFGTYDFNALTRAVIMAHDRCIRFSIESSGPGMLKLRFHKRHLREGQMHERHPTIEQAISDLRIK